MLRDFYRVFSGPALICLLFTTPALAGGSDVRPESWDSAMSGDQMRQMDRVGEKISDVIFDGIDNIKLFRLGGDDFTFDLRVRRRVFDNADILNSWTVVDRFEMSGGIPILTEALSLGSAFSNTGFFIGANSQLDFINIRQVVPPEYPSLPPPGALKDEVQSSDWYKEYVAAQDAKNSSSQPDPSGEWASVDKEGKTRFEMADPEDHARYSKLWRLLVFPFRFPLKASAIDRLEDGEIVSYVGEGSLEVGASVGWNPDVTNLTSEARMGISYRTYVTGSHRISILKESDHFVRVKATRVTALGHRVSAGGDFKPTPLDGIIVLKNLQRQLRIVPFDLDADQHLNHIFDVGYRYDMRNPQAREAYNHAVIGRLGLSDELAVDEAGNPRDFAVTGVQKVFMRDAHGTNASCKATLRIGFIWRRSSTAAQSGVDAVITFPDGTHHVFTSEVTTGSNWRLLWGTSEKLQHNFTVTMDLKEFARNPENKDAFHLMMEGRIQDTDTSEKELTRYALEVENSVGKPSIFPIIPNVKGLGRSHFYYQMALDNGLLYKFINLPEEQMWGILEKAFSVPEGSWSTPEARRLYRLRNSAFEILNLPLYVTGFDIDRGSNLSHAKKIFKRWRKLALIQDPKERAEELGKLFFDRLYGYELIRLVRTALDGESVSFYVSGSNSSFGRIIDQGGSQLRFDNIGTRVRREIDFDQDNARVRDNNPAAVISNLSASVLNPNQIELKFDLEETPVALFFQVRVANWWWPFRKDGRSSLLVPNRGEFKKGTNAVLLDRGNPQSAWYPLAKDLMNGNIYAVSISTNVDRIHWGPLAIEKFRVPKKKP